MEKNGIILVINVQLCKVYLEARLAGGGKSWGDKTRKSIQV